MILYDLFFYSRIEERKCDRTFLQHKFGIFRDTNIICFVLIL